MRRSHQLSNKKTFIYTVHNIKFDRWVNIKWFSYFYIVIGIISQIIFVASIATQTLQTPSLWAFYVKINASLRLQLSLLSSRTPFFLYWYQHRSVANNVLKMFFIVWYKIQHSLNQKHNCWTQVGVGCMGDWCSIL